jgi:hypothetical protein
MATNAERQARWREKRRAEGKSINPYRKPQPDKSWCFVDTEGANDPTGVFGDPGRQYTYLICAAADDGFEASIFRDRPLTTREMLNFILDLPAQYRFGGYFFGYDRDMILRDLPEESLRTLYGVPLHRPDLKDPIYYYNSLWAGFPRELQGKIARPEIQGGLIHFEGIVIDSFHTALTIVKPSQEIPEGCKDIYEVRGIQRKIWDVGRFYNSPFVAALADWKVATPEEDEFLTRMKADRKAFDLAYWEEHWEEVIRYSLLENKLGARLQAKFDAQAEADGFKLSNWFGAGSMGKAMMRAESKKISEAIRNHFKLPEPSWFKSAGTAKSVLDHLQARAPLPNMWDPLARSYFGGRFEIQAPGEYAPLYEYDIRSAYPASYRDLPCLIDGEWGYAHAREARSAPIDPAHLYQVTWKIPASSPWGPFPSRNSAGYIYYPARGSSWVWGVELEAALKIWPNHIKIQAAWLYHTECDCRPWEWIADVWQLRESRQKNAAGFPLKLGMNSCYGSILSVLGAEFTDDQKALKWHDPRWGSFITAWCRARLLQAVASAPDPTKIVMFATDGIYSTEPIPLDTSKVLGGWEAKLYPNGGLVIQPGINYIPEREKKPAKSRGIDERDLKDNHEMFTEAWRRDGVKASVELPLRSRFNGIRQQLNRRDLSKAWRFTPEMQIRGVDEHGEPIEESIEEFKVRIEKFKSAGGLTRSISFDPSAKRELRGKRWMPFSNPGEDSVPYLPFARLRWHGDTCPTYADLIDAEQSMSMEGMPDGPYA